MSAGLDRAADAGVDRPAIATQIGRLASRTAHAAELGELFDRTGADELLASTSTFDLDALRESDARPAQLITNP